MKILIASMIPSFPLTVGNRARVHQLSLALQSLGHELHFAYVGRERGNLAEMEAFYGKDRLHVSRYRLPRSEPLTRRLSRRLMAVMKLDAAYTYGVDDWYDPALDSFFRELDSAHAFDAVIVEYVFLSRALGCFDTRCLRLIDTHDVFADRHKVFLDAGQAPGWFSTTLDEELIGLNRADAVLAIQDREREYFATHLPPEKLITIGHIVRTSAPITDWDRRIPESLLFVGNDSAMNKAGLRYFVQRVLPEIQSRAPNVRLLVAGSACDCIANAPAIDKLGQVPDISAIYAQAWIALNPVQNGTGLAIKSMEALGYALPLVSTVIGIRGLEAFRGQAFVDVPDQDARGMAQAVLDLLANPGRRSSLSLAASEFSRDSNRRALTALEALLRSSGS